MSEKPQWLPEIISMNGNWDEVVQKLYRIFEHDFKKGKLLFNSLPVICSKKIIPGEKYEDIFWHIITKKDKSNGSRLTDFRRAEKLPWCSAIIRNSSDKEVTVWDYIEGSGDIHTYLWLEKFDYVVVLVKRKVGKRHVCFLVTAYHIEGDSGRRSLRKKYAKRIR